jgi:hypothetical protein
VGEGVAHEICVLEDMALKSVQTQTYQSIVEQFTRDGNIRSRRLKDSSGVYIYKSVENDLKHGNLICKSEEIYLKDSPMGDRQMTRCRLLRTLPMKKLYTSACDPVFTPAS